MQGKGVSVYKGSIWRSGGTDPLNLNLTIGWEYAISLFTSGAVRYPLNMWLGGPHRRSGHFRETTTLLPLPGIESQTLVVQNYID